MGRFLETIAGSRLVILSAASFQSSRIEIADWRTKKRDAMSSFVTRVGTLAATGGVYQQVIFVVHPIGVIALLCLARARSAVEADGRLLSREWPNELHTLFDSPDNRRCPQMHLAARLLVL
jgi:hypothetical protein